MVSPKSTFIRLVSARNATSGMGTNHSEVDATFVGTIEFNSTDENKRADNYYKVE